MSKGAIPLKNALVATICHTSTIYGAPLIGLPQVKIPEYLGEKLIPEPEIQKDGRLEPHLHKSTLERICQTKRETKIRLPKYHKHRSLSSLEV